MKSNNQNNNLNNNSNNNNNSGNNSGNNSNKGNVDFSLILLFFVFSFVGFYSPFLSLALLSFLGKSAFVVFLSTALMVLELLIILFLFIETISFFNSKEKLLGFIGILFIIINLIVFVSNLMVFIAL